MWENLHRIAKEYQNAGLRKGQALMCALSDLDSDLYDEIQQTVADCYYLDEKVPQFLDAVCREWYP
jgi:hypothetical protein